MEDSKAIGDDRATRVKGVGPWIAVWQSSSPSVSHWCGTRVRNKPILREVTEMLDCYREVICYPITKQLI